MSSVLKLSGPLKVGSLPSDPSNPEVGYIYFDSTNSEYKLYDGSQFQQITDQSILDALAALDISYDNTASGLTATNVKAAIDEVEGRLDTAESDISSLQSGAGFWNAHLNGLSNKHDASEIEVEAADGKNHTDTNLEAVIGELDDALGDVSALGTPTNYSTTSETEVAARLDGIDTALATAGASEFADDTFRVTDNGDSSKKIAFEASGITTSTTRTVTMPDSDVSLADIATNTSNISNKIDSSEKGAANGVATLDAGSKIPQSQLPAIAITDVNVVADIAARDALTVQEGDVAIVNDAGAGEPDSYIYDGTTWQELKKPANAVASVNGESGVVVLDTDDISEGATNKYYSTTLFNADLATKSTDDVSEGTAQYFTEARVRASQLSGHTASAGTLTDGDAIEVALEKLDGNVAAKMSDLSDDTTPSLGGDLTLGANTIIHDTDGMKRGSSASNFLEEEYIHDVSLTASQTNAVMTDLTFAHASFEGCEITYKLKEATSNDVRIGTMRVVTNGTTVALNDMSTETADVEIAFDAVVNGANINIRYTSGSNAVTMRCDVKRIKA